jgi:nitrate reductase gamma subunit
MNSTDWNGHDPFAFSKFFDSNRGPWIDCEAIRYGLSFRKKTNKMMREIYLLAEGPLFIIALALLAAGIVWRVAGFISASRRQDPAIYSGFRPGWATASVLRWILPSGRTAAENAPALIPAAVFHVCLPAAAFLSAHVILINEYFGVSWPSIASGAANSLTIIFLACAGILAIRRIALPHVRALTGARDWLALILTILPFLTGYLAYNQYFDYQLMITLHAVSGLALIAAIPFTKLSHAFMFFVSRAVTGSDFGKRGVGAW